MDREHTVRALGLGRECASLQAIGRSGRLRHAHRSRNGYSIRNVRDDGLGIEPACHPRNLELFQTLGRSEGIDSTGAGLSIARKAIEGRDCSISIDSTPGQSATFTFDWPADVDPDARKASVVYRSVEMTERRAAAGGSSAGPLLAGGVDMVPARR